jgi:hypothetical protein
MRQASPDVIRTWARQAGYHVCGTGRIPLLIVQHYRDEVLDPPAADDLTEATDS